MPQKVRRLRCATLITIVAVALAITGAATAHAGTIDVSGTCGLWSPYNADATDIAVYPACPTLIARNAGGPNPATGAGLAGGWRFDAPSGMQIESVTLQGALHGLNGWQASAYTEGASARDLIDCPGVTCPGASATFQGPYPTYSASAVVLRVRCGSSNCPNTSPTSGEIDLTNASVTLADVTLPAATISGGSLVSGGWVSDTQSLVVSGSDNTGIQETRAIVDGGIVQSTRSACSFGQLVPCPNGAVSLNVNTAALSDGQHYVYGQVLGGSGNPGTTASATIDVDNTPPTQPLGLSVDGGTGWRPTNTFKLSWTNPTQTLAPIAGAAYSLCPSVPTDADASTRAAAMTHCVQGTRSGDDLDQIDDLSVPDAGLWDVRVWLVDAAGNQQPASAAEIDGLGYDGTPPSDVAFLAPDPADPARIHVQATDATSGLASGVIEARRDGQDAWQPLATQVTSSGLTAFMDDETLPKGLYFLRATVANGAELETSNDRDGQAQPATLKLPIRLASTLTGERRGKRVCHGHGHSRSCRYELVTKPHIAVGKATILRGRLTVGGKALPQTQLEVWRLLDVDGAQWTRIGTVTTSKTGRFTYRAQRGPARSIRFRYDGTDTIRGRNRDVALRLRAATTIRPNRTHAVNGESVTFRGRLKGGWLPAEGALVELQVFSRGEWRTFAQPRAAAANGRWSYVYRFETVAGHATFRFRARVRAQPHYPFTLGTSRPVRVDVRGL